MIRNPRRRSPIPRPRPACDTKSESDGGERRRWQRRDPKHDRGECRLSNGGGSVGPRDDHGRLRSELLTWCAKWPQLEQVLQTANMWVSAYNAINLFRNAQLSQARAQWFSCLGDWRWRRSSNAVCAPAIRRGTATSPCVAANGACQSLSDGGCWQYRTFDSLGNVIVYLVRAQAPSF